MSDKLMETAPGGQSTQYESIKQFTVPPAKEVGQLGDPNTATKSATTDHTTNKTAADSPQQPLEQQGGAEDDEAQRARRAQGYGGERDSSREVGA
ncbi:hypothetical protein IWZ01DRAFT_7873 [Phyllosticta capitalensis]